MQMSKYQEMSRRTMARRGRVLDTGEVQTLVYATKLAGEVGEVCELIGKEIGHGVSFDREDMKKELGDVLWYVAALATVCDLDLSEIAEANLDKLAIRYPDGFVHGGGIREE